MFPTEYSSLSQLSNEYSIPKSMYFKQVGVTQTMKDDVTTKVCLFSIYKHFGSAALFFQTFSKLQACLNALQERPAISCI